MSYVRNDEAVSPVIGVILMVAITVILAAVIASYVFGMTGNIQRTRVISGIVQQPDALTIVVTYQGGPDASACIGVRWTVSDPSGVLADSTLMGSTSGNTALTVGYSATLSGSSGRDHVVATGYFSDGTQQVILDSII